MLAVTSSEKYARLWPTVVNYDKKKFYRMDVRTVNEELKDS
jgi:hypothetical protein